MEQMGLDVCGSRGMLVDVAGKSMEAGGSGPDVSGSHGKCVDVAGK